MAITPTIQVSEGRTITVLSVTTPTVSISELRAITVFNFPSESERVSQVRILAPVMFDTDIRVSQLRVISVVRGRSANPRLRAWTFTMDGHDFYVLRLGDSETLIYDVYSKQWSTWSDATLSFWRPNIGINWLGGTGLGHTMGSDVVVGDDTFGLLWFLDPKQGYDQHPDYAIDQNQYFERIVMGQVPMVGRSVLPCNVVYLGTDVGAPAYAGAGIQLLLSDDGGNTFQDQGFVTVPAGDYTTEVAWRSLGQIAAPGRLFKIIDDGASARIDELTMNDEGGQ